MKKFFSFLLVLLCATAGAQRNVYSLRVADAAGQTVRLKAYKGKPLLIVNTATRCGFTPQYKELEALYEKYRDRGFCILDFPCNQFGAQAPGTMEEIHAFCTETYGVEFPQFQKIEVNGAGEVPLYTWLKAQPAGKRPDGQTDIRWNFTKFLIDRKGKVVRRFEPAEKVSDIEAELQKLL